MRTVFENAKVIVDGEEAFLCLSIPYRDAKKFVGEMKPRKYVVELKEYREKRSMDANAYMWVLLDRLADVVGGTKEERYLEYVKRYGLFRDWHLKEEEAKTFRHAWQMLGIGWPTEQVDYDEDGDRVVIRAYYGTSTYNTKQMSRIISAVVEDCKELGIETLPPAEIVRLVEASYGKKN